MAPPPSPMLSASQLRRLAELGEERTARRRRRALPRRRPALPVHRDPRGRGRDSRRGRQRDRAARPVGLPRRDEPAVRADRLPDRGRHRAAALHRGRPRRASAAAVRRRPAQRSAAVDVHRAARGAAAGRTGSGSRSSARARPRRRCGCSSSPAATGCPSPGATEQATRRAALVAGSTPRPAARAAAGGVELRAPSTGEVSRALGIGRELAPREEVDLLVVGAGPAGLGAAVYGASEGLETLVVESTALGGQAGSSRRIENYLGFPAGISGHRADEPRGRAGAQVRARARRRPTARCRSSPARTPRRAARGGARDRRARGAARDRRAVPAPSGRRALATTRA